MRLPRFPLAGAVAVAALVAPAPALAAEAFYGVTSDNSLATFASDSPSRVQSVPLTGLAPNEQALAIDVRPATGQVYVLGNTNRVYLVSPLSGASRALGEPFTPQLAGSAFGFDFNPVVDRIRIVSNGRQNLRLNPADGQVTAQDNPLVYAEGDTGAGSNPQMTAAAYTNNAAGATATQLFGIDSARDVLVLHDPPNAGTLKTVGALNVDLTDAASFDIGSDGRAWVAGTRAGGSGPELFAIDLKTGALSAGAKRPALAGGMRAIGAAGAVPDDTARASVVAAIERAQEKRMLRRTLVVPVSCSETCTLTLSLERGSRTVGKAEASLATAGRTSLKVKPNNARRSLARRRGRVTLRLRIVATDAAGNRTVVRRTLRFN